MSNIGSNKKQGLLTLRQHEDHNPYFYQPVFTHLFICCVVFFVWFVFILCLVPNVACIAGLSILECPCVFLLTFIFTLKRFDSGYFLPLCTVFQLYRHSQFYRGRKEGYFGKLPIWHKYLIKFIL